MQKQTNDDELTSIFTTLTEKDISVETKVHATTRLTTLTRNASNAQRRLVGYNGLQVLCDLLGQLHEAIIGPAAMALANFVKLDSRDRDFVLWSDGFRRLSEHCIHIKEMGVLQYVTRLLRFMCSVQP